MAGLLDLIKSFVSDNTSNNADVSGMQQLARMSVENEKPSNAQNVFNLLIKRFKDPSVVAGIMGNIGVETGETFDFEQKERGGSGHGLFQFTYKPMKEAYGQYLSDTNQNDSAESQVDFIHNIVNSDKYYDIGSGNRLKVIESFQSKNPELIAEEFSKRVERPGIPHLERRKRLAKQYFSQIREKKK